jgi:hypothetical protein
MRHVIAQTERMLQHPALAAAGVAPTISLHRGL